MYYKILKNGNVIDVLDRVQFVKYQLKNRILMLCNEEEAVFCKTFLHKIAKTFCRSLQLHFVGNCKPGWQSWYLPAI